MIVNAYLGEVTHKLKTGKTRRFRPEGEVHLVNPEGVRRSREESARANPVERLGSGGYSARIFVGLKVGQETRWTIDDVIRITYDALKKQARGGPVEGASILAQHGIYEDTETGERVIEPSVQIIVIDLSAKSKEAFTKDMEELAEDLRKRLEQQTVILEIQKRGVVEDVCSVT
jgi:hypothetical protein